MEADIIVLSSDEESSMDIMTDSSEGGESEGEGESEGTYEDSESHNESDDTYHEGGTEEESEIEEIEAESDEEMETEDEALEEDGNDDDDEEVVSEVGWPALPAAGDAARWVPILEALCVPGYTGGYVPVMMPTVHHVCSQCCLLFTHPWDLTRHMVTHVGQDSQACSHCLEKFKDALTLEQHTAAVHQEKLNIDIKVETDDERKAQWESDILADLKQIDEYTKNMADKEVEILGKKGNSAKREKIHPCFQCGSNYGTPWELTRHQMSHAGEQLNKCSHCGMYFSNPDQLVEHVKTHPEELSLQCVIDIEDEPQPEVIEMMINKVRPAVNKVKPVITKVKPTITKVKPVITKTRPKAFKCAYCPEVCDNLIALNGHIKYSHKCRKCPALWGNAAERRVHMQTHEVVKHRCNYCRTKYFDTPQQLKHHMKNFHECSQCSKTLINVTDFNKHMLSHEQEKLLKLMARAPKFTIDTSTKRHGCCQCEALFCCPYDLTRHMMSHMVPSCQTCTHCQQAFRNTANLELHIAAVHSVYAHKTQNTPGLLLPKAEGDGQTVKVEFDVQREAEMEAALKQIDEYTETRTDVKVEVKQEKKLHKCAECKKYCGTPWDLTRHTISHIVCSLTTCGDCGLRLTDAARLQEHMETHVKQSFLCPHCAEEFTVEADFDTHIAAHAEDNGSDSANSGSEDLKEQRSVQKSYECTVCDAVFYHSEQYISHMMGHSKHKSKRDQSRHKPSTSRESGRYNQTLANVVELTENYGRSLKRSVQGAMSKHLPKVESVAPTEPTRDVTPSRDEFLSTTDGNSRMMKYGAQTVPPPLNTSTAHSEHKRYLPQAPEGFSSSSASSSSTSSSQRGRNVQLVRPMIASNVVPAATQPNPTLTRPPIPSTRQQPAINPHVAHMYQSSTSSSSLATANRSDTLRASMGDLYSSTLTSGQAELDNSLMYIPSTMSSASVPTSYEQHILSQTSDMSLSAIAANQYEPSRNIQVIQPMSSFDDLVAALATNDSLSAIGRQHDLTSLPVTQHVSEHSRRYETSATQHVDQMYSNVLQAALPMSSHVAPHKPHPCSQCSQRFSSLAELDQHFTLHLRGKDSFVHLTQDQLSHKCSHCTQTFHTSAELTRHKIIHHDRSHETSSSGFADMMENTEKPHQCPICGQKFVVIWEVENHMVSHAMPGFQACFICKRWFDTAVQLHEHQATHREDVSKTSSGSRAGDQAASHSSNVESRKRPATDFADNSHLLDDLIKHRRLYSDENLSTITSNPAALSVELPHVCYICGLGFAHPHTLRDHIYSHAAEVPQSCSVCQQWFTTTAGLLQHQLMHH